MRTPARSAADEAAFLDAARPYWHPVARSADVGPGQVRGVRLLDEDLVLWRAADGALGLADDLCPHRGTMLSAGGVVTATGTLACPYHAWEFDPAGRCRRIPQLADDRRAAARVRLATYRTAEHAGLVWACLVADGEERRGLPAVPQVGEPGWWWHAGRPQHWQCQAPRMVENYLDVAHFGVLHAASFGNPDVEVVDPYHPVVEPDGLAITYSFPYLTRDRWSPPVDGRPATRFVDYGYRVELPFAAWIRGLGVRDTAYYTYAVASPVSARETTVHWVVAFPDSLRYSEDELDAGFLPFFEEDRVVVEQQRPEWLPLDLGIELQMPFDRIAVAYRRALLALGFPVLSFPRRRDGR